MKKREKAKKEICKVIDKHSKEIIEIGEKIFRMPEKGFQEFKTSSYVQEILEKKDIPFRSGLAITGVRADLKGGKKGPTLALLGELDALPVPDHPLADKQTGAAHACGHNAQIAGLLGAAIAFKNSGIMPYLSGNISFMAVPAEELNDIEYRLSLRKKGKISFLAGKQEFIKIGCFDDVDMAMMIHTTMGNKAGFTESHNGFVFKFSSFEGKAAHAAGPHSGINTLQAANIALTALNAQNETFKDNDRVRVHSVYEILNPAVNVVPPKVIMETQVRASSVESIIETANKTDRALKAGALALGAKVSIQTIPGYMPTVQNKKLIEIYKKNVLSFIPEENFFYSPPRASSTDMGDVSQVIPSIHPYLGGAEGSSHGNNYNIKDKKMAYVTSAKMLALCAIDLLWDGAVEAKTIIKEAKMPFTKEEYLAIQEKAFKKTVHNYMK